ncbi:MAG: enoyl-CoA hydratase [Rhodospirillaceae bacterium]|jgi:enoyl-CoA hydratase|nr:enoyl-CoA hydratase [Rhodospirillaceae bacterium]MBT5664885.1 enoyl-CoA hydratase [Rhodospirillaceae bacterium]MBT5809504.1 enoyl-CoA hydratase [Rhodospirillaceae bacterium]
MADLELTRREEFAIITLNRPKALNALSFQLVRDIAAALDEVETSDARAVLFTGAGDRAFCAGADIKELTGLTLSNQKRTTTFGQRTFARLDSFPIPSVAVINGYAFGGGMELASACTFRVATPNAKMGLPEIKLGLIPGYGGTQRLPRLIGQARALEIIMSGRTVEASEAERIGLVSAILEGDAMDAAMAFARTFTCYGLPALSLAREAVLRAGETSLDEGLNAEADLNTLAFQTEDAKEGMAAFTDKRPAVFKDV